MNIDSIILPPIVVQNLSALNFNVVATLALSIWDVLLTVDREVQYIWKAKFSWVSIFFGINRVLTVGGQIILVTINLGTFHVTEPFCRGFYWFRVMYGVVMFVFADILLITRLFAFYERRKILIAFLCIMELIAFGGVVGLSATAVPKYKLLSNPSPSDLRVGSCIPLGYPSIEPDLWVPLLPIQTILFGFSIGRHIYLQRDNLLLRNNTTRHIPNIYQIFIRDGVWAFFVLFLDLLLCVIGNALHMELGPIAIQWSYPVIGICISRLILNLRHSAQKQSQHSQTVIPTISGIAFGDKDSTVNSTESLGD